MSYLVRCHLGVFLKACTKVAVEVDKVYAKLLREGFLAVRH